MRLVVIESPYAPQTPPPEGKCTCKAMLDICPVCHVKLQRQFELEKNQRYLAAALAHSLSLGEAPYASHGLYTLKGVLDDTIPAQQEQGIAAGFAWGRLAEVRAVYTDLGISSGMRRGIDEAKRRGQSQAIEWRTLPGWKEPAYL